MVSVETFVIQPFLVEIPMPPVMKRRSEFLFVLVMKLLESGRHARHWQSSCFLAAAPFTILTACRVLVLSLFMEHLYIICCLAVPGDSEKKSPYVMTDDFHLVKS